MFKSTNPLILRRGAITKPKAKRRKRQRTPSGGSQAEVGDSDSIPIPLEGLSVHDPIAHQESEEIFVQSTIFQSNSWSARNESMTRRNRFLTRRRTKQSSVARNTSGNSSHSTLGISEASHRNECSTGDRVALDPSVLRIKDVVHSPMVSGGRTSTSDDGESRKMLVIEKEGKEQTRFVRVSSAF
jgi:IMP dehydrogenase/GMP reductase